MHPKPRQNAAGWVLVGGQSRRMGRDKATLPAGSSGLTLAQAVALTLAEVSSPVTLLGDPARYGHLGYPVLADIYPDSGPLGGIHAALQATTAEWNVIVACDLAGLTPGLLGALLDDSPGAMAVIAPGQPLCGVYHRDCLPEVEAAVRERRLRVRDLAATLKAVECGAISGKLFNINTLSDFSKVNVEEAASR